MSCVTRLWTLQAQHLLLKFLQSKIWISWIFSRILATLRFALMCCCGHTCSILLLFWRLNLHRGSWTLNPHSCWLWWAVLTENFTTIHIICKFPIFFLFFCCFMRVWVQSALDYVIRMVFFTSTTLRSLLILLSFLCNWVLWRLRIIRIVFFVHYDVG